MLRLRSDTMAVTLQQPGEARASLGARNIRLPSDPNLGTRAEHHGGVQDLVAGRDDRGQPRSAGARRGSAVAGEASPSSWSWSAPPA